MAPAEFNKRKILLVTNDLGPRSGGIETFILGLLAKLDGSEVVIYTSAQDGSAEFDAGLVKKFGVVICRDRTKILLPTPRVTRHVATVMRKYGCETVWFGAAAPLGLMAPALRRAGAKRVVGLTHGHEVWWAKVPIFNLALRRIGNSTDVLTYLGEFTKSALTKAVGKRVELKQIAPGISTEFFSPGVKSAELLEKYDLSSGPTLICVGRLVHRKGQDKLILAMPEILKSIPNAQLLIVGSGPRETHLRKTIANLNLGSRVKFSGRVTYDELPEHIRLGDVFVMPSRSRFFGLEVEGLGIVYLEASSCGIPVIAGNSGGAPDAVSVNETGLVVDGTKTGEIAKACIKLLADPKLAKELGANGRKWAVANWNWDIWGTRFEQVLKGN
jgi:phosphatidylinositol alpha-1,6-mannosyltransferase